MNDVEFRAFLDLLMCSDPWPEGVNHEVIESFLDRESINRGHANWVVAYHDHMPTESV